MSYASIEIAGKTISETFYGYRRWFFVRGDRVVRTVTDAHDQSSKPQYLYVVTAAELRHRLELAGFTRASLEREFKEYAPKVENFTKLPYLEDSPEVASMREDTVRLATLDDWLAALRVSCRLDDVGDGDGDGKFAEPYQSSNDLVDIDLLAESITNCWMSFINDPRDARDHGLSDGLPQIDGLNFPCASLECAAVAMLELVSRSAECVLDATSLVEAGRVYCFDDLAEQVGVVSGAYTPFPHSREKFAAARLDPYQFAALYDDI
jgi:hypothetical protein